MSDPDDPTTPREAFLAGERTDDVLLFLADGFVRNADALDAYAERVEDGYVLVLPGDRGRALFPTVAGRAPMEFAQEATERAGSVDPDLTGGRCPDAAGDRSSGAAHALRFLLAFAQAQTDDVGGPYEAGDVVHAYAQCTCGTAYSDRWVVGDRTDG